MVECDGNCAACPIQCASRKIVKMMSGVTTSEEHDRTNKEPKSKGEKEMATVTSTSGCGAPKDVNNVKAAADIQKLAEENERLQREIERLGSSTPLSTGIKTVVYVIGMMAFFALAIAMYALSQTSQYADSITSANITAAEAQKTATDAVVKAEAAESRADKNYVYLRDMKRDMRK